MKRPEPFSLFSNAKNRVLENQTVKFLLFMEDNPKHRVMENVDPLLLVSLSLVCFVLGVVAQAIFTYYTVFGFLLYYVGILIGVLELFHCLFDR